MAATSRGPSVGPLPSVTCSFSHSENDYRISTLALNARQTGLIHSISRAAGSLPCVARAPAAGDGSGEVQFRRRRRRQHQDVTVLFGRAARPTPGPAPRLPLPRQPAQPLVEAVSAGAERPKLEPLADVCIDFLHQ